jgi:hypothetical protein
MKNPSQENHGQRNSLVIKNNNNMVIMMILMINVSALMIMSLS